ncbi:E3 ubiquitin-protein ligase WAV3-like [Panicum virgatum]|uniref:E3 ubiquitin-protein ligase WAV3-like n=1 Tax=Panicum virgatum TaxID=38727 RepID=UPI0019D5ECD5|nr:E3 ubiquitin-protein ligase WAV3-like [Panicum virgatum]
MVRVKAPALVPAAAGRAPVDLVAVLDVRGSMAGAKLELVKRGMGFVIDSLGPRDRLSVVVFSDAGARRVVRLTCMSEDGKATARHAAESLVAAAGSGPADLRGGLDEAAKVFDGRRHKNDNVQVHTLVFGADHDAAAMHGVAEATGGTFSFVESRTGILDALAQCVGGLLSLAAEGVWIEAYCGWPDASLSLRAVKSGRYESRVAHPGAPDAKAYVELGDLYAGEERRFLMLFDVESEDGPGCDSTYLMKLSCRYCDTATDQLVEVHSQEVEVKRPLDAADVAPSVEVKRELLRVEAAEDMARAREAAERGAHAEAARILGARRESLLSRSASPTSGDVMCEALAAGLRELSLRVSDTRTSRSTGARAARACSPAESLTSFLSLPYGSHLVFRRPWRAMASIPSLPYASPASVAHLIRATG